MEPLEQRIQKIEKRNKTVELDKAWETSWARKLLIAAFTYIAIGIFLSVIKVDRPWLAAIVPAIGFTLSTLTMPFFKSAWKKRRAFEQE